MLAARLATIPLDEAPPIFYGGFDSSLFWPLLSLVLTTTRQLQVQDIGSFLMVQHYYGVPWGKASIFEGCRGKLIE